MCPISAICPLSFHCLANVCPVLSDVRFVLANDCPTLADILTTIKEFFYVMSGIGRVSQNIYTP